MLFALVGAASAAMLFARVGAASAAMLFGHLRSVGFSPMNRLPQGAGVPLHPLLPAISRKFVSIDRMPAG
jgi:hypothetical protein